MRHNPTLLFLSLIALGMAVTFPASAVKPAYFNLAEKGTDTLESRMQQYTAFANTLRKNKTDTHSFAIRNMQTEYNFSDLAYVRPQDAYLLDIGITVYNETYGNIYGIDDAYLSPDLPDEVMQIGFRQTTVGAGYQCYLNITLRHNATAALPKQDYTAEYMPYRTATAPHDRSKLKVKSPEAQKKFFADGGIVKPEPEEKTANLWPLYIAEEGALKDTLTKADMYEVSIAQYRSYHTEITQLLSLQLKDCKNGAFFARAQNPVLLLPKYPNTDFGGIEDFIRYPIPAPLARTMGAFMLLAD